MGATEADSKQTSRPQLLSKELSKISKEYDIGDKGFLTPVEQKAREMDIESQGRIPNEQVVSLLERTEFLQAANRSLKRWMVGLLLVTVVLGASQIGTAIAAARLSKDMEVDASTGQLMLRGQHKPVVVVSTGRTTIIQVGNDDESSRHRGCIKLSELSNLWAATVSGSNTNAVLRASDSAVSVSFTATGSMYNETHTCLMATDGTQYCSSYSECGQQDPSDENDRRLVEEGRRARQQLFHQHIQRNLFDFGDLLPGAGGGGDSGDLGGKEGQMNPGYCGRAGQPPCEEPTVDFGP